MKDGLNELDQTHAIFSALGSFWWRLVVFFLCCWLGFYVGANACTGGEFLREVWQDGPRAIFSQGQMNPLWVPLRWFWTLLAGCEGLLGIANLFILGTAFLIVRLSEDGYFHGFAIALITQPIYTIFVVGDDMWRSTGSSAFDFSVAIVVLVTFEGMVGAGYLVVVAEGERGMIPQSWERMANGRWQRMKGEGQWQMADGKGFFSKPRGLWWWYWHTCLNFTS